jgi:fatty-acyl-CoA synthase
MRATNEKELVEIFIKKFPSDPESLRTISDIEKFEKIPQEQRFTCNSPNEALSITAKHLPDNSAITFLPSGSLSDEPHRWTYAEYQQEVIAAANLFYSLGLQVDDSVVFLLPTMPEMLFGLWAAQAVGIAAPINPFLTPEQMAGIAKEADARIIVTLGQLHPDNTDLLEKAQEVKRRVPSIQHIITIGDNGLQHKEEYVDWHKEVSKQPHDRSLFERVLLGSEIAAYFHTGGTTGTPKLAQHTHRAEVVNVCQMLLTVQGQVKNDALDSSSSAEDSSSIVEDSSYSVNLCGLPLFHVNAPLVSALSSVLSGGELILVGTQGYRSKQFIHDFWEVVERFKVTSFFAVPTVYAALLEQTPKDHDLSSLTHGSCGAAPMPVSLLRDFHARTGAIIMEGYGMTETSCSAASQYINAERHVGSVGMRLPYLQMRTVIIDEQQKLVRDCEVDEIGLLLHSGPNVILAYKQAFANDGAWPEPGWLNSGDMGRVDEQGNIWITGRAKDLIIRGGHNIDPSVTEDSLARHPEVAVAAAVGMPDAYAGELPVAYVTLYAGATVTPQELVTYSRENALERAGAAVQVFILDELPQTAVGKIFKPALRNQAIARAYTDVAAAAWQDSQITAEVVDDKAHGLKVLLRISSKADVDSTQSLQAVDQALNKLAYVWELKHIRL